MKSINKQSLGALVFAVTLPWALPWAFLTAVSGANSASAQEAPPPMNSPQVEETAKRLLFFGNSFSVYDDVPGHVRSLAALAGHPTPLVVADLALGTDLAYHIGQVDSYPENNVAHASLDGTNTWDWVVIQGYSTEATHLRDPAVFKANALSLFQRVKNHASGKGVGVSPLLFQTWARAPGHSFYPVDFVDPAAMQLEIRTGYQEAAQIIQTEEPTADVRIAPVGDAFERGGFDPADLYASDLYHAGNLGPELAALVLYKTLYATTVTNIPYGTVSAAGWTNMSSNDWVRVTCWAEGLTPPGGEPGTPGAASVRDVYLIDAAGTPAASGNTWNSLDFHTAAASTSLLTTNGLSRGATCTVVTRMSGSTTGGASSPSADAAVFLPAGSNASYGNASTFSGFLNPFGVVSFDNLSQSAIYSFTFYGSRMDGTATDNRETLYTVTGATTSSAALDCLNNSTQVATVSGISPAVDGTIQVRIEPGPNNDNSYGFYYISAMSVAVSDAEAEWVATNADVPATMDAGGVAGNPALYLYQNGYVGSLSGMTVGSTTTYNQFHVTEGSEATVTGTSSIGNSGSLGRNAVRVTGAGSKMTIGTLYVGIKSDDNMLTVEAGGEIVATGYHYLGFAGGGRNALVINGGSYTGASARVYMTGSFSNSLVVSSGSLAYMGRLYVGSDSSCENVATVEGAGTRLISTGVLFIGNGSTSSNNTLTVANGALARTDYPSIHSSYCLGTGAAPGNYLRLAGGFVASKSRPDYVLSGRIQVWNADDRTWEAGVANINYTRTKYAIEESAFAATGYTGLGGYYVYAGGDYYTPPPEPVVFILK